MRPGTEGRTPWPGAMTEEEWVDRMLDLRDGPTEDLMRPVRDVGVGVALNRLFDAGLRSHNDPDRSEGCVAITVRLMRHLW